MPTPHPEDINATEPPPKAETVDSLLNVDINADPERYFKLLQDHVKAAIPDPIVQQNLLTYNFDPQSIQFLDLLPPNPIPGLWMVTNQPPLYRGDLFDDMPIRETDVFASSPPTIMPSTDDPLQISEELSCEWPDKAVLSTSHGVVENVRSSQACQYLCQSLADPIDWRNCPEGSQYSSVLQWLTSWISSVTASPKKDYLPITTYLAHTCEGISYLPHSRTCILHERIKGLYHSEGVHSAPSICKGGSLSMEKAIYEDAKSYRSCFNETLSRIRYFDEPAIRSFVSKVAWSNWFYSPNSNITKEQILDLENRYITNTLIEPKHLLGTLTHVNNIASCIVLCITDPQCLYWNWLEDEDKHQLCYKTQNKAISMKPLKLPSTGIYLRSANGHRSGLSDSILSYFSEADLDEAKAHAVGGTTNPHDCVFHGYVGFADTIGNARMTEYAIWQSYVKSVLMPEPLASASECQAACETMLDCRSWSYAHGICDLHTAEFPAIFPVLDGAFSVGFNRLAANLVPNSSISACWDKTPEYGSLQIYNQQLPSYQAATSIGRRLDEAPSFTHSDNSSIGHSTLSCQQTESIRFQQVSIRGRLIEGDNDDPPNVVYSSTSNECEAECFNNEHCLAWTYGTWGGCYLFDTLDQLISDSHAVSGLPVCLQSALEGRDLPTDHESAMMRTADTCVNSRSHVAFAEGNFLAEHPQEFGSANDCWQACRATQRCFDTIYIGPYPEDASDQTTTAPPQSGPMPSANETNCIFFEDLNLDKVTSLRQATYFPSHWYGVISSETSSQTRVVVVMICASVLALTITILAAYLMAKRQPVTLLNQEELPENERILDADDER